MNIKDTAILRKTVYALNDFGELFISEWDYQAKNPSYKFVFISDSKTDFNSPCKMISLFSDDREIYALGDNSCIYRYRDGERNLSKFNWVLERNSKFFNNETLTIKQIISKELILASDNQIYEWKYIQGSYCWVEQGKPISYLVSSISN